MSGVGYTHPSLHLIGASAPIVGDHQDSVKVVGFRTPQVSALGLRSDPSTLNSEGVLNLRLWL